LRSRRRSRIGRADPGCTRRRAPGQRALSPQHHHRSSEKKSRGGRDQHAAGNRGGVGARVELAVRRGEIAGREARVDGSGQSRAIPPEVGSRGGGQDGGPGENYRREALRWLGDRGLGKGTVRERGRGGESERGDRARARIRGRGRAGARGRARWRARAPGRA
jgi:hypothetical protein